MTNTPAQELLDGASASRMKELGWGPLAATPAGPPVVSPGDPAAAATALVARVIKDVWGPGGKPSPHDGLLANVPVSWDWEMASVMMSASPASTNGKNANSWCTVFRDALKPWVPNCKLRVKSQVLYSSVDLKTWRPDTFLVNGKPVNGTSAIDGGAYFYDTSSSAGQSRNLPITISTDYAEIDLNAIGPGGPNVAHFWPRSEWPKPLYPAGVRGIATVTEMMVVAPSGTDPHFLGACSADIVLGATASGPQNQAIGIPCHQSIGVNVWTRHGFANLVYGDMVTAAPGIAAQVKV